MDTTSLATTFPFVSSDLSDDKGVMYGINEHNGSLVIFDRFSMPNYNSVVFATAGAGKSYMIKLEAMRSLMLGSEIIVIDPENEYKDLCEAVGGQYVAFGYGEDSKINPFDLSLVEEEGENALNAKILSLHKLFKTMIGEMDPMDESILDRAIMDAYKMKGITPDPESQSKEPPLIEDLYKSLIGMEDPKAQMLAARFEKFIKGSFAGIFNQKTTINLENSFVVFGVRNLEEALRPLAMHVILDYIWTVVKKTLKKRILVVDEAWYMMQYPDSASFLRGIVKRGRKYYLGVTTITQDVDDFLETPFGKEIVTNSSIQILLKQHSAAIDKVGEIFYLSEGEKQLLLAADKGEGIFFAGQNHVAIKVIASEEEDRLISSNPEEILKWKNLAAEAAKKEVVPSQGVEQNTFDQEAAINKLNENQTSEVDSEKVVEAKVVENKKPVDVPAKEEVVEKAEVKVEEEDEVVEVEDVLSRRIREMEEAEKLKLDEHQKNQESEQKEKQAAEEAKNKLSGEFTNFGAQNSGLPKYQDLFKSPAGGGGGKLPPLPPLPKFEPIIPQPPQLAKKPEPVLGENPNIEVKKTTEPVKNESKNPVANKDMKPDTYDKLFGNGIV
ncbi:MAG: Type IV secretory pathway VirB4 component-like protein [Candidatus Shapirobacteria bacterium GW2011_GWE1_38_92]|nr:MAG: Type IV secretory pathway VirB4 component-like protein [Candidatus Shapirobacteria bacterium GW2011_GWE1_38_92]